MADEPAVRREGDNLVIPLSAIAGLPAPAYQAGALSTVLRFATPTPDDLRVGGSVVSKVFVNDVEMPVGDLLAALTA
jgi:hypothetical protein